MSKHEEYEELCALALVGDASREELDRLRSHLQQCEACRREYREFAQLVLPQLWAMDEGAIPGKESVTDTADLRASFLERAGKEGIVFSPETRRRQAKPLQLQSTGISRNGFLWGVGAMVTACLILAAVVVLRSSGRDRTGQPVVVAHAPQQPPAVPISPTVNTSPGVTQSLTSGELAKLQSQQQELQSKLEDLQAQLAAAESARAALKQQLEQKTGELNQAQTDATTSQQMVTGLRDQVALLQTRIDRSEASFVADQGKIRDLTAEVAQQNQAVDRERQMLAAGRDMRDMMAARNLHIVDVADTDSKGKTSPAFGRIFFAEDKQLVFYAYDLNQSRLENARYDYRIWGQKEGQPHTARSLGIFFSDDKAQRRWVFQCDDPKVLSEIDSVFVTLEPSTADPQRPRGTQLMYAYLRGQPNHP